MLSAAWLEVPNATSRNLALVSLEEQPNVPGSRERIRRRVVYSRNAGQSRRMSSIDSDIDRDSLVLRGGYRIKASAQSHGMAIRPYIGGLPSRAFERSL